MLYDPDLGLVASWDFGSLLYLEHKSYDGLVASLEGVKHGVLVKVPISLIEKAGTYHFVLRIWDNHAHLLLLSWAPMRERQEFGDNHGNGKPKTAIGKRIFTDLPVPPDQLPADDDREAYRKAKVIVQVWDEPDVTKTVYLRLFDPDDPSAPDTEEEIPIDSNDDTIQNPLGEVTFICRGNDNQSDGTGIPATGIFEGSIRNRQSG